MAKLIKKIKASINGVSWPKRKEIISDTILTVSVTVLLSTLIFIWTTGVEIIVDWVVSLF